jgi:hypothetical protein
MKMRLVMLTAAVSMGVFSVTNAFAQQLDCKSIQDPQARLACFDKLTSQTKSTSKKAAPKEDAVITQAKAAVAKKLKDPTSPLFTELKRAKRPNLKGDLVDSVCGFVNAKNSYGGYSGAKPFYYDTRDDSVALVDGSSADIFMYGTIYKNMCK